MMVKKKNNQAQLLNFYVILWRSYLGTMIQMNELFSGLLQGFDSIFQELYPNANGFKVPEFDMMYIMIRYWNQVVLKADNDPLENILLNSFES